MEHLQILASRGLCSTNILDSHAVAGDRGLGQNHITLLDVEDGCTRSPDSRATISSLGVREGHIAEVSERDQTVVLLEVLDDPLGIGLTEGACSTTGEGMGHRLASRNVIDCGSTSSGGSSVDSDLDHVSSADREASEIIGIVRVPFIPGIVRSNSILDTEVDTGLQYSRLASIPVDAHPRRGTVLGVGLATCHEFNRESQIFGI